MWSIHTMEYYAALKNKATLAPATMWMDLEDIKPDTKGQIVYDSTDEVPNIEGSLFIIK